MSKIIKKENNNLKKRQQKKKKKEKWRKKNLLLSTYPLFTHEYISMRIMDIKKEKVVDENDQ